ncbi:MAG: hypothetical protein ACFFCT_07205 [Candidatus Odinarchaeota archaeon]
MGISSNQDLSEQKERIQHRIIRLTTSMFKVLGHSLILLFGYLIVLGYLFIFLMNSFSPHSGNYIFFLPQLMVVLVPLVLILLGAVNSYSVSYIYRRKIDDSWSSLLLQGIFMLIIGFLFYVVWLNVVGFLGGPRWPPFYMNFGPYFIVFYLLLIPSTGYTSKEVTIALFRKKEDQEKLSKFEDR